MDSPLLNLGRAKHTHTWGSCSVGKLTFAVTLKGMREQSSLPEWHGLTQILLLRFQYSNTHTHGLQKSRGGKGATWPLSKLERDPFTPAWTGFIVFLGPLHQRWPSFIIHRFVLGGYLLLTTERMSLNTSKEDICNIKGEMVEMALSHTWRV